MRADGQEAMSIDLIYPAMLVFLLMLIGVILTAVEFRDLNKDQPKFKGDDRSEAKQD